MESYAVGRPLRFALLGALGIALAACVAQVAPPDISSSICRAGRPAIRVAAPVDDVFRRILAVAAPDLRGADVRLTVVSAGTEAASPAWSCGSGNRAEIVLLRETIEDPRVGPPVLAHIIGHEIAHVVLHHPTRAPVSYEKAEAEADELAVAYLVQAGYECKPLHEFLAREPSRRNRVHTACERVLVVPRANPS